jgi:hypothetical protein
MAMVMNCNSARAVAMVVVIAAVAVAMADAAAANTTHVVGGASQWTFGFNYTAWADTTAPFYTGDSLGTPIHSFIAELKSQTLNVQNHNPICPKSQSQMYT